MKLHLLGVNGPFPEPHGSTSGYLLECGSTLLQLDLGSGILSALTAKTPPESVSALLLSHWHYDHVSDLGILMYRLQALGLKLPVFGPRDPSSPFFQMAERESCFDFTPVGPGDCFHAGEADVRVTRALHPVPTVGYCISCQDETLGYTGDTNWLPSLPEDFRDCGLLLADGLFPVSAWTENKPHLSARLAAQLAADANAKQLVITHLNPFQPRSVLLNEARTVFPKAVLAEAGHVIDL